MNWRIHDLRIPNKFQIYDVWLIINFEIVIQKSKIQKFNLKSYVVQS